MTAYLAVFDGRVELFSTAAMPTGASLRHGYLVLATACHASTGLFQPRFSAGISFRHAAAVHATYVRENARARTDATHARREAEGSTHGRVKEAKINCNLIRGSKPGPIAIRCASAGREEWRRAWDTDALYTSRLRGLAANADGRKIRVSFKTAPPRKREDLRRRPIRIDGNDVQHRRVPGSSL